ncbi:hypothetical protein BG006_005084 [Podila minutissima]|uniref:Uncharacterized protein n=1 Tax=Podila minutissima TaxID=64525 RepID=A0A9P5SPW8_9FUNG|nr:hypothetical protein BG006_005084 [Podila minutissima]
MTEVVFPAVERRSQAAQACMIERFSATVLHSEFPNGALVMTLDPIKGDKLSPCYEGPYSVVEDTAHGAYVLRDGTGALLGRHYTPSQLKLVLDNFEDSVTYEVECIIDHRQSQNDPLVTEYYGRGE